MIITTQDRALGAIMGAFIVELDLPMYDTIKEQNDGIPQKALDLAKEMEDAQGYIFASPEYNFSAPPVLLNMIAWISLTK